MRVTNLTMAINMRQSLIDNQSRLQAASGRLASGRRIERYSDGPSDAASVVRLRAEQADWESYDKSADDALAWLNTQDAVLQEAASVMHRVRELTLQAGSSTTSAIERDAIGRELGSLRNQLIDVANSTYLGRSLFGGFGTDAVQQVAGAWAFTGDNGSVLRRVAPDVVVQVNADGQDAFGFAAGADVFSLLDTIAADAQSGNVAALGGAHLDSISSRLTDITNSLAVVGARTNQVESAKTTGSVRQENLRQNRSVLEDIDYAESVLEMQLAENSYQAALAATARMSLPSLVNFLQ